MINKSFAFITGALFATTVLAHAHAFADYSEPRVGSTVAVSPAQVKIWFTERLDHASSTIKVFDAQGHEVDRQNSTVDAANESLMSVSLPKLPPGEYKVEWSAVALDTHHTTGTFSFDIRQP